MTLGGVGNDLRECGLACAWRAPQNDGRKEFVRFDGAPQEFSFAHDVFLPDVFIKGTWTHARGEWGFAFQAFVHGVVEEVVGHDAIIACGFLGGNQKLVRNSFVTEPASGLE